MSEICRGHDISSDATFYIWKKKYSGLSLSELRELRQLCEENAKLKRPVANASHDRHVSQEIVQKSVISSRPTRNGIPTTAAGSADIRGTGNLLGGRPF